MKKNLIRFVLTIYLLTLAVVSHAQVLKGTVIDAATGEVLIGASIQLKGTTSVPVPARQPPKSVNKLSEQIF